MLIKLSAIACFLLGMFLIGEWNYSSKLPKIRLSEGKEAFEKYCMKCHSLEAGENGFGPSLHAIASVAATRKPGLSAQEYLWESVVDPAAFKATEGLMPVGLASNIGREKLFQIVAYLMSTGNNNDFAPLWSVAKVWQAPTKSDQSNSKWSLEKLNRGKAIFHGKGKCAECHVLNPVNAADHLLAPNLSGVGINDESYLAESMKCPSCYLSRGFRFGKVMLDDELVSGRLIEQENAVILVNRAQTGYSITQFSKTDGIEWSETNTSLMPAYSDGALSPEETEDLILFLRSLR